MEDYGYSDNYGDYHFSDQEDSELKLLQNDVHNFQVPSSKAPTAQVITKESLIVAQNEELHRVVDMLARCAHIAYLSSLGCEPFV
ncbi:RBR-type E3 ubiquitin transferase [Trifolium repens]|nr:RBR-type E3 ubiquitin transferase [Trifolium repens]